MRTLSRNAQVLRYLLQVAPGIGHIQLAKFAYLADLEARRYLGKPVSEFAYVLDPQGPFDPSGFSRAWNELRSEGLATEHQIPCGTYTVRELLPTNLAVEFDFSAPEAEVLRYVAITFLPKSARDLLDDIVYKTEPMVDAQPGKPLPMDRINGTRGAELTFNLERMLLGEASVSAGRTRPWVELRDELRAAS